MDRNAAVDGFRIYRSLTPLDDNALPAPLATLAANVFEYIDTTALRNTVYYYKIGAYLGAQESLSLNKPLAFMPYTGPGPQTLIRGDYKVGFFGEMLLDELIGYDDFRTLMGITGWATPTVKSTKWLKFVNNGTILFFPADGGFATSVQPAQIYIAGLMYGTNLDAVFNASLKSTFGTVNQVRPLTIRGDVFIPRLPISRANRTIFTSTASDLYGGEIDTCFGAMYLGRGKLVEYPLVLGDYVNDSNQFFVSCSGTTQISRGSGTFDAVSGLGHTATHPNYQYRPVLELVL
ncbi:hypothetical protein D3C80_1192150 [compost metagenome]